MQAVITGVAGFIGSNLAKRLLNKGYSVIGIDSLTPDNPLEIKNFRLKELEVFSKFEFIKLDILNPGVFALLGNRKCDYFIHLAAKDIYYHKENAFQSYSEFFEVNTLGSIKMYELAHQMGAKRFVATSTFSVYGNTKKQKLTERKILPNPISPHGASKIAMETALKYLNNHYCLSCVIPRVFSVYGPNMPVHTALYNIIASAITGRPLKLHGDFLDQTRDFIYIDDVLDFLEVALTKRLKFQIFNLATGRSVSLRDALSMTSELTGKAINMQEHAHREDVKKVVVNNVQSDVSKATKLFKLRAKTSFLDGLRLTVMWYQNNPEMCKFMHYS